MERAFEIVACGVDDLTIGFDMSGSPSVARLNEMPGLMSRRGKILGERASWGAFVHLLGRSVSFWRQETSRLYVQAKLADEGQLCPFVDLGGAVRALMERMSMVGLVSYEPAWVTRIDVAVDGACRPEIGKLLLDALEACRLPNGWRTRSVGVPRSTVYFTARASEDVKARAYCRNLKTKTGEPFGLIRLEAEHRYEPLEMWLDEALRIPFPPMIWSARYGNLAGSISRVGREIQAVELLRRVQSGALTYAQGERMSLFLDVERLGVAEGYYPRSVLASRKREARTLGLASNECGTQAVEVDLAGLLAPYIDAVSVYVATASGSATDAGVRPAAQAVGTPAAGAGRHDSLAISLPGL
jgi:hypothetical protein